MANYILYIAVGTIIFLSLACYALSVYIKIKKAAAKKLIDDIPQDIINNFQLAEKMLTDSKGQRTPYEIMWEIAKNHDNKNFMKGGNNGENITERATIGKETISGGDNTSPISEQSGVETTELSRIPQGGKDIQDGIIDSNNGTDRSNQSSEQNTERNFFSRLKRKK